MTQPPLPNLFVIGAEKAGTSSLHLYLSRHPEISMTTLKEPNVFAEPGWEERLPEYAGWLRADAVIRGETSTRYSNVGVYPGVATRIESRIPGARIIYMVREPIDRILSHYRDRVRNGDEDRSLADSLADYESTANRYVGASRYGTQLEQYMQVFPREQILVIDQRELLSDRTGTMRRIHDFLEVSPLEDEGGYTEQLNADQPTRLPTALGTASRRLPWLNAVRRLPLPEAALRPVRRLLSRPVPSDLPPRLRADLERHLAPEVAQLRSQTGLNLGSWPM